jgi:uracil-DNA glycosylase
MIEHFKEQFHESWLPIVTDIIESQEFLNVLTKLQEGNYTPHASEMFKAFRMPVNEIKLIILGQDPYPQKGVATGLAFGVSKFDNLSPSLEIMLEELLDTIEDFNEFSFFANIDLEYLERQGVLLLNSALTTKIGRPGTHKVWYPVIQDILLKVPPTLVVKLGKEAQQFKTNGTSLEFPHPAADTYGNRRLFRGSNIFNIINSHLINPIIWNPEK